MGFSFLKFCLLLTGALIASKAHATSFHFSTDNDITGNDFGYSGGFLVEIGELQNEGWSYGGKFSSQLYSQRLLAYGDPNAPSYAVFTDWRHAPADVLSEAKGTQVQRIEQNSTLTFTLGHHTPKSWFSWSAEAGLTQTESQSSYLPLALGFQTLIHRLIRATRYRIISDGIGARFGGIAKSVFTMDAPLVGSDRFALMGKAQLGGSLDTEGRRRFLSPALGLRAVLGTLQFGTTAEAQLSSKHRQVTLRHAASFIFPTWTLEASYSQLLTHTGYSDFFTTGYVDQDPIYLVSLKMPL